MKLTTENTWKWIEYNLTAKAFTIIPTIGYYQYKDKKMSAIGFQWLNFSASIFWDWRNI